MTGAIWRLFWREVHARGYVLVSEDHYRWVMKRHRNHQRELDMAYGVREDRYKLTDRIRELEAEVEGHIRVNNALAARVVACEHGGSA